MLSETLPHAPFEREGAFLAETRIDEALARFRARVAMHVQTGWQVIEVHEDPSFGVQALLMTTGSSSPRATGRGGAFQEGGMERHYCRRVQVDRFGTVTVRLVACPLDHDDRS